MSCNKNGIKNTELAINKLEYVTHNSVFINNYVFNTENPFYVHYSGICYAQHPNPTVNDSIVENYNRSGTNATPISGLKPNTNYYVKVYAYTDDGYGYSNAEVFKTNDVEYFTDPRDGQKYPIITIGNQTWFASNLNYKTSTGSYYFNNDSLKYANEYGLLYTFESALIACPDGWHIPSDDEWKILEMELGMSQLSADSLWWRYTIVGNKMKEPGSRLWNYDYDEIATNQSGLTVKPAGIYYLSTNEFSYPNSITVFWCSSLHNDLVYTREFSYRHGGINRYYYNKSSAMSVRCVKN